MIGEIITWSVIGSNVLMTYTNYRQWKKNAGKLADYDIAVAKRDDAMKLAGEINIENRKLLEKVDALTAPDKPWQYIYNGRLLPADTQRIEDWLAEQDNSKFAYSCEAFGYNGVSGSKVKFATEDRNLAMLFKLTFGGAQ